MCSGAVRRAQLKDPRRVMILDRRGIARWHPVWDGNPRMARPGEIGDFQFMTDCPGIRPYIAGTTPERWTWRPYDCAPGEIYFSDAERAFARPYRPEIVIEPHIKPRASPNKRWPGWQEFAELAHKAGYSLTQMGPAGTRPLQYVKMILTPDFRLACAVLANARAYVGPDGGLHHSAAALNIPAVVIRGAFISQRCTGYASQRNLFTGEGLGCGMRIPCGCCTEAMAAITPEMVLIELKGIL